MNVLKEFPSEYITATDLVDAEGRSTRPTLTIRECQKEVGRDPKTGRDKNILVLAFRETQKRVRCNPTSRSLLVKAWGYETDNWLLHQVTLEVMATNLDDKWTHKKKEALLVQPVLGPKRKQSAPASSEPQAAADGDGQRPEQSTASSAAQTRHDKAQNSPGKSTSAGDRDPSPEKRGPHQAADSPPSAPAPAEDLNWDGPIPGP